MRALRTAAMLIAIALVGASCGSSGSSDESASSTPEPAADTSGDEESTSVGESSSSDTAPGETVEWEEVRVFIEYNSDSGDYGFHAEFGGDPWSTATITGPDGGTLFDIGSGGSLAEHGMSGVFFESAEFPPDELTLDEFLSRFPEGDYTFTGETIDGETLAGTSTFTHFIPEPPEITDPVDAVVSADSVIVAWDPVTEPEGVEIEVYTLQLFPVDPPEGEDPIALNIDYTFEVPGTVHQIRLLPELFQPGETYEYELMAVVADGNQTFSLGSFAIEEEPSEFNAASLTNTVDNPYFPLPQGAQWEYEVMTADGAIDRLEVAVLPDDKTVMGIETTSVQSTLFVDEEIEEITISWYAQDDAGNVWLLGEIDEGYEDGKLVETATWEHAVDSAQAGIVMPAPDFGEEEFRVNFVIGSDGAVTERGRVITSDETVDVTAGAFSDVRVIEGGNSNQPAVVDRKHYAPGVGLVFEDSVGPDTDTTQLLTFSN